MQSLKEQKKDSVETEEDVIVAVVILEVAINDFTIALDEGGIEEPVDESNGQEDSVVGEGKVVE